MTKRFIFFLFLSSCFILVPHELWGEEALPRLTNLDQTPLIDFAGSSSIEMMGIWVLNDPLFAKRESFNDVVSAPTSLLFLSRGSGLLWEFPHNQGKIDIEASLSHPLSGKDPSKLAAGDKGFLWVLDGYHFRKLEIQRNFEEVAAMRLIVPFKPKTIAWVSNFLVAADANLVYQEMGGVWKPFIDMKKIGQKGTICKIVSTEGAAQTFLIIASRDTLFFFLLEREKDTLKARLEKVLKINQWSPLRGARILSMAVQKEDQRLILWLLAKKHDHYSVSSLAIPMPSRFLLTADTDPRRGEDIAIRWSPIEGADRYIVGISQGEKILASLITEKPGIVLGKQWIEAPGTFHLWSVAVAKRGEVLAIGELWIPLKVAP